MSRRPTHWRPTDWVALILAAGLSLSIVLILVVSAIQVTHGSFPQVKLSDNATQIITAGMGGLTGLLGAYIGVSRDHNQPTPPFDNASSKKPPDLEEPS